MSEALTIKVVYDNIPKITADLKRAVREAAYETAKEAQVEMIALMRQPKSGRLYRRGRIGRRASKNTAGLKTYTTAKGNTMAIVGYKTHRASAPGEAPAVDLGHLVNSLSVVYDGPMSAVVYTAAAYAAALEFGRPERNLAARPYMRPAVKAVEAAFFRRMQEALRG